MRTIAILNRKGGVGKTTTTAVMADCLAADYGKRILLIDADSQGSLSQRFGVTARGGDDTLALLQGANEPYYPDFVTHARNGIDIIPAGMSLMYADADNIKENGRCNLKAIDDLRLSIAEDAAHGDPNAYDYILIDCAPAMGAANTAALGAADEVIVPLQLDALSTAGFAELATQVSNMRRKNQRLRVGGVLATMYQRTEEADQIFAALPMISGLPVYRTKIRQSPRVPASTCANESLLTFSPHCGAAKDYRKFVQEFLDREEPING